MAIITFYRGDSYPLVVTITDTATGDPVDITGANINLTVDSRKNPTDETTKQFSVAGSLTDAVNGVVEFTPSSSNNDLAAGTYYYDIQMVIGATIRTLEKDKYIITQDLNKS